MASISFEVLDIAEGINAVGGSGLGFYGSSGFSTSVSLLAYQDTTYVTNSDGTAQGTSVKNVKYVNATGCYINPGVASGQLWKLNSSEATLTIHFDHSSAVRTQNQQLRIYDRSSVDNPATGVITKIAEIVNFADKNYTGWVASAGSDFPSNVGSGDAFWWGAPWPETHCYAFVTGPNRPYYQNSVGVKFYNFTDTQDAANSGNPDSKLVGIAYPGKQTVGGSGLIVPLMDSPGSGGRLLAAPLNTGVPKFTQYVNTTSQASLMGMTAKDSGTYIASSYGGTGTDTRHTWRVAISASPLSIGSKAYGCFYSLEYY